MGTARTNAEWLANLGSPGPEREAALADLRAQVLAGLPRALSPFLSPADPRFEPLAEETAQETLLRVLDRLHTFEGRSQFTTWAHKIAIRVALTELRRQRWKDASLDDMLAAEEAGAAPAPMGATPGSTPRRVNTSVAKYPQITNTKINTTVGNQSLFAVVCARSMRSSLVLSDKKIAPIRWRS